ncbi:uncharacterized protein LOC127287113 [Leptopilina boulardi]|uniref:uncharacterized protein LOC127287113 n=1 Tax=Leptopilina boulardi TaxID=63433 RepID=UPI0021F5A4A4|nr:uncharacterized protein LOC127287113 [Leptopilina boulardi]
MNEHFTTNEFSEESKIHINSEFNDNNENQKDNNVNINELDDENKNQKESKVNTEENTSNNDRVLNKWMIRPCHQYKDEYLDCTSMKSRFHQYFVFGETIDCSQWRTDYDNCEKWNKSKNTEAFDAIVTSETERRFKRFKAHYANNVWKKRDKPPEDWSKPLPEWLVKKNENSYLEMKNQQLKSGTGKDIETNIPWCCIL